MSRSGRRAFAAALFAAGLAGCGGDPDALTVYAAVDRATAAPVVEAFERAEGVRLRVIHDAEALKTVGLAERLRREKARPTADVWWSGETFHTARLAADGCFEPLESGDGAAEGERPWVEFAARLRVLVYRPDTWPFGDPPRDLAVLADPRLKGKAILARPTVGTSATHAALLAGTPAGRALLDAIAANDVMVVAGNAHVVTAVRKGQAWVGLTDSDDAAIGRDGDDGLAFVPARHAAELAGTDGVVVVPSSAAVVRGARHAALARRFVRFVAGPEGEALLARSAARHLPLEPFGPSPVAPDGIPALAGLATVPVDHVELVRNAETRLRFVAERLDR